MSELHTARRHIPQMSKLAKHWAGKEDLKEIFPELAAHTIGWGEPFCFRCGALAPVDGDGTWNAWDKTQGWLEKAHLHERFRGGNDDLGNIVPMCKLCHREMTRTTSFDSWQEAVDWVTAGQGRWGLFGWLMGTIDTKADLPSASGLNDAYVKFLEDLNGHQEAA